MVIYNCNKVKDFFKVWKPCYSFIYKELNINLIKNKEGNEVQKYKKFHVNVFGALENWTEKLLIKFLKFSVSHDQNKIFRCYNVIFELFNDFSWQRFSWLTLKNVSNVTNFLINSFAEFPFFSDKIESWKTTSLSFILFLVDLLLNLKIRIKNIVFYFSYSLKRKLNRKYIIPRCSTQFTILPTQRRIKLNN